MKKVDLPHQRYGLYHPSFEHDGCGIGFVVHVKGERSHAIVRDALRILVNLDHRGGVGGDPKAGDGAGILTQIPDAFFRRVGGGIDLPRPGEYAVGTLFLPPDPEARLACEEAFAAIVRAEGGVLLGWRTVPVDESCLGPAARAGMPAIRQVFVGRGEGSGDEASFLRKLYVIRRAAEKAIRYAGRVPGGERFYVASLSSRTIVYKGLLTASQVPEFYPDLADPSFTSAIALVHSRYSTNTFPSWERAHPYRYLVHNGEINTLRANINWMRARESAFARSSFGAGMEMEKLLPVLAPDGSDSAIFENCLEFLLMTGRSLPHAVMMMIPEPWEKAAGFMSEERRAFYEYHSYLMEPWDGPAAMAFTDGVVVGAVLDRNGLRPARYWVTEDDLVILASESGVIPLPPERIRRKERLRPGRILLVDTAEGRIVADEEIKEEIARAYPYRTWIEEGRIRLSDLPPARPAPFPACEVRRYQKAFGYTHEDLRLILGPMAQTGVEPVGSMGYDAPLAVLSERPQLLYDYFKQLFAQVTNPPIDAIREEIVTATELALGPRGDLIAPGPEACRQIRLEGPILTDEELARIKEAKGPGFEAVLLPILFPAAEGGGDLAEALEDLFRRADEALAAGAEILILSDRGIERGRAAIPALLAVAGLHHHLIRQGTRTKVSLVLESGEPREVHHFALLLGYGLSAVNPYLAFATLDQMIRDGLLEGVSYDQAAANYVKAATKGVLKAASKMGISTLQGYQGAQVFEAVGLAPAVVDRYFTGTPSRVGGIGLAEIAREARLRHAAAFAGEDSPLPSGGHYHWRRDGEDHLFNPETVYKLQRACRTGDWALYREYAAAVNERGDRPCTLRGLFALRPVATPLPLAEVEPVEAICRRFKTGAMSFGSISQEAHETLAIAMNRLGGKSNTGEGGEDPARFVPLPDGDSRCSAIKQVASGRFGVTSEYLVHAEEIQIKIAQGAKPGEGGQLPGGKVYPWIARVRHATPGVGLISPPPHHDIYSIEDLAELIYDLKNANPRARISVKLVSAAGVGTIAVGVAKAGADVILISGYDGGTGAAPRSSIRHAGLPWELGLAETHQTLLMNGLRHRVTLEVDGKLMTGRDVVIAALLGAEEFGFATAPLVALGCDMMRHCNLDTCPVGIATQNPILRRRFAGRPEHVVNLMGFIAREAREIMAGLGFRNLAEMVGRTEALLQRPIGHWKAEKLDLSALLYRPEIRFAPSPSSTGKRTFTSFDREKLLPLCRPALEEGRPVRAILPVRNTDRAVGTMLGSEVTRRYGVEGLPEETIRLHLLGSAGQSFGAFLPRGITLILEGDANDYLGKGLSGGRIAVYPPATSRIPAEENVIVGNVALYGATNGEAYIRGVAGERFCVRNSGARAVVEGVGDHGCEYMTGGRVVVLGPTGRNFAAGMSGGIAYVLDEGGDFPRRCNLDLVELERLEDPEEMEEVEAMIRRHLEYTGSEVAKRLLARWDRAVARFVKVMPKDYKRALAALAGAGGDEGVMAAFEANKRDLLRVSGN